MLSCSITATNSSDLCKYNTGLGNVLFQLSSLYGLSKECKLIANFNELEKLLKKLDCFNLNHRNTIFRNIKIQNHNKYDLIIKEKRENCQLFDNDLLKNIKKNKNKNILIKNSYLQSHLYFNKYRNNIINLFYPDEDSIKYMKDKYPILFDNTFIKVSIHIRQKWGARLKYNNSFIKKAINYIKNLLKLNNIIFCIFGDDINDIKKLFKDINEELIYFEDNFDYIDLWCMSLCDHNILSHSTLSWWGAYLNNNKNKIVIYSEDTLRLVHSKLNKNPQRLNRKSEYLFDNWICLKCKALYKSK